MGASACKQLMLWWQPVDACQSSKTHGALQKALREEVLRTFCVDSSPAREPADSEAEARATFNELILDHLRANKLQYTLAVFQTEAGCKGGQRGPERLLHRLQLEPGSMLQAELQGKFALYSHAWMAA